LFNLGLVYEKMGRIDDALLSFEKASEKDATFLSAALKAAQLYRSKGSLSKARKVLEASQGSNPGNIELLMGLAELSVSQGEADAALVFLGGISPQASLSPKQLLNMAVVLVKAGETAEGIEVLSLLLETDPNNAPARSALGWALIKAQEYGMAKAELGKAIKLSADNALAHNNLGVLFEIEGDVAAAQSAYALALQYAPDNPQAKANLARVVEGK
jgi:Flp pilus assembly protein TadD